MGNCCSSEAATATIPAGGRKSAGQAPEAAAVAVETHEQELSPEASLNEPGVNGERVKTPDHGSGGSPRGVATPENGGDGTPMSSSSTPSSLPMIHTPRRIVDGENGEAEAPGDTHTVRIGNYNLRYSYYSKRGYYPEARKKANQDSYYCETHFAGDDQKAFFAVFDGHGQYGDVCAQYAADQLPVNLAKHLQDNVGILPALTRAHVEINQTMHEADFDDSMSGTTAISVLFCGNEIHIANVGDSRAIIAQEDLKAPETDSYRLIAKPLSIDQTPFRKDERERVKKCGARILTVDQVEGLEPIHENWGLTLGEEIDETGDPPRIWHPYGQYPGTAFTRSIGDLVSEELGVVAEPEILCKGLNVHDRFIVIASDGVFEFLTSQNVVDIVQKFDDPSAACQALVEEAYNRWLQFEVRTDDITAVCIFLDGITQGRDVARGSIYVGREVLDLQSMQRPVRGVGRKDYGPRNTIVGTEAIRLSLTEGVLESELEPVNLLAPSEPAKSDAEVKWIKDIVQGNFLFNHLSEEKILEVISVLKKVEVTAGEVVIRQGSPGDTFYLVDNGEFEVRQLPEESEGVAPSAETDASPEKYGGIIHVYKSGQHLHPTFGELALIYSKPRAATVIAKEDGSLWALDRLAFRSILMRGRPMRDVVQRLRQISLLRPLTVAQTNLVAEEMKAVSYAPEQVIVHEGNNEQGFFLITSGKVEAFSRSDPSGSAHLKAFDYFGEVSLVRRRSISQRTLRAVERTECLFINKETLELAVGKLSSILDKDKIRRSRKDRISAARKNASENAFVFFDDEAASIVTPTSIDDIEVVGSIFSNVTNTVRLVSVKGADPPVYFTLRTVSKQAIYDASMQKHVCGERDIYVSLYEKNILVPHVCGMNANDTDIHYLYDTQIVGDLDTFLEGETHGESFVRYYAAQVVLALEFLHAEGIVCRTVDPTNLLVDRNGNIRMLNLRLSKYVGRGRTYTVCGTPEYLSPEQIKGEGHNIAADYWSLGVLMYELLCGHTPFSPERKDDIEILNHIASFNPDDINWPENTSAELRDIVSRLLCPELTNRLGYRDVKANFAHNTCDAIKNHPFFAGTSWEAMKAGSFAAPLEAAAAAELRDICARQGNQDVNIGSKYSGDFEWLSGF